MHGSGAEADVLFSSCVRARWPAPRLCRCHYSSGIVKLADVLTGIADKKVARASAAVRSVIELGHDYATGRHGPADVASFIISTIIRGRRRWPPAGRRATSDNALSWPRRGASVRHGMITFCRGRARGMPDAAGGQETMAQRFRHISGGDNDAILRARRLKSAIALEGAETTALFARMACH